MVTGSTGGAEVARDRRKQPRRRLLPGDGPLAGVHPALAFLVVLAVFALGVWLGGVAGALLLGALAAAVGVLLAVTWPGLTATERSIRLLVLLVVVAIALQRLG